MVKKPYMHVINDDHMFLFVPEETFLQKYKNFLNKEIVEKFDLDDKILFTAPSAVTSYNNQFGKPRALPVAIGNTTADQMRQAGWGTIEILRQPDVNLILEHATCQ